MTLSGLWVSRVKFIHRVFSVIVPQFGSLFIGNHPGEQRIPLSGSRIWNGSEMETAERVGGLQKCPPENKVYRQFRLNQVHLRHPAFNLSSNSSSLRCSAFERGLRVISLAALEYGCIFLASALPSCVSFKTVRRWSSGTFESSTRPRPISFLRYHEWSLDSY